MWGARSKTFFISSFVALLLLYGLSSVGQMAQVLNRVDCAGSTQLAEARKELLGARSQNERLERSLEDAYRQIAQSHFAAENASEAVALATPGRNSLDGMYFREGSGVRILYGQIVASDSFGPLFERCRFAVQAAAPAEGWLRVGGAASGCWRKEGATGQVWRRRANGDLQAFEADGVSDIEHEVWRLEAGLPPITILVPTMDRPKSLRRALDALNIAANMKGRRPRPRPVHLVISIDRAKPTDETRWDSREYAAKRNDTIKIAEDLIWPHGRKEVRVQLRNLGLALNWLQNFPFAGDAVTSDELFMVVEDDIEVSPLFFVALDAAQENFDFVHDDRVAVLSLFPIKQPSPGQFFWYRNWGGYVCSWAPVWRASAARRFVSFLRESYGRIKPYIGHRTYDRWIDQGRDLQSTWTARFLNDTGMWMGCFNLGKVQGSDEGRYLVVNHHEAGMNEKQKIGDNWERFLARDIAVMPKSQEWRTLPRGQSRVT
mmetsp:Transcript_86810/g.280497  ORF Transcript_86810/g.280497 Transcript_86810/m.280497 type:complete len:489 (+) Transcript_86810:74-1540(+)